LSLLEVRDLHVWFDLPNGPPVHAVAGVSFDLDEGERFGLVGESGCGKTTVGKAILQLIRPEGEVRFGGVELSRLRGAELRAHRRDFQIIFQDPYASLNPRMRVADILAEGMASLGIEADAQARSRRVAAILDQVGLARDSVDRYPHEFSGGQRQRIAIARALAVRPKLIVCDEPTSALDVSVQLQTELKLSYLFITHNIAVVEYLAHEVAVMYLGRIVERGTMEEVLRSPKHPYTQALLAAVPKIEAGGTREVIRLEGELPSPVNPPSGCHFHPRCPKAMPECRERYPENFSLSGTRGVACWLYKK
jgi:peptide/nickel transport system ATP-binding protein